MILHAAWARADRSQHGRIGVDERRQLAAACREEARVRAAAPTLQFLRDDKGAPLPEGGWHWSVTNTRGLVASVVAPGPVGIDAEWRARPRLDAARERFEESGELATACQQIQDERDAVLALWTSKEAVLKLTGIGIADLARVPLIEMEDERSLVLEHRGTPYTVRLNVVADHVLAVASADPFTVALTSLSPSAAQVTS